ncbi:hypothetical protein D210916BOD24_20630 [Alteromonas sp. D210916BOD_24]|uniref:hypothetical protein n=1 Tax=Alteromonas sp. D210916BOD_24 TaxID=3157618 RepID=UPI00399C8F5D
MKKSGLIVAALLLTGCQHFSRQGDSTTEPERATDSPRFATVERHFCLFDEQIEDMAYNCDPRYWLNRWIAAANTPWSKRKQQLATLDASKMGILHAYILALPNDTPYQIRLRTQLAFNDIAPKLTPSAQEVINVIARAQNNQVMELESALVVLEQENTSRGEKLKTLQQDAANLRTKLEELLRIEATLMDKNRSTQP